MQWEGFEEIVGMREREREEKWINILYSKVQVYRWCFDKVDIAHCLTRPPLEVSHCISFVLGVILNSICLIDYKDLFLQEMISQWNIVIRKHVICLFKCLTWAWTSSDQGMRGVFVISDLVIGLENWKRSPDYCSQQSEIFCVNAVLMPAYSSNQSRVRCVFSWWSLDKNWMEITLDNERQDLQ